MSDTLNWMIYGATGYTGVLVAEEAVKHGHRPILAGRNEEKLRPLATRLDLEYRAFGLDDVQQVGEAIADMAIVYHAAGPFVHTALPMIKACLATKTHYLDITGELNVFEQSFSYDEAASKNGIVIISGVGFDVVPTDCMARYVAEQVPNATHLEIALAGFTGVSAGTSKSFLEMMPNGTKARRNGQLETVPAGKNTRVSFPFGKSAALAIPWGDLSTGYRTTQIPNITTYMAMPGVAVTLAGVLSPIGRLLFSQRPIRNLAG
ncbi:MAG: saccharopine dehydrogenase family protein, partial [Aggregatilineales bacterium]